MTARLLDGKAVAATVKSEVSDRVAGMSRRPGLATILVGADPASHTYVRGKRNDAAEVGIRSIHHELDSSVSQAEVEKL
ncbi:MAG TPA: tetrahydrofolate dehydrogenase/cyclohydrolase catalytic domain-containing protein, partial [Acidimicrobiia bacterium]|nr:tetrahydrofolate dehydrogenase/cyclohydrolase catalytic domain-containing protein [Acidimicrobiia bacterium]